MIFKRLVTTYILIIVLALSAIGALVFSIINTTIKEQFIHSNQLILNNGVDLIANFISENKDLTLDIAIDNGVQTYLDYYSNVGVLNIDVGKYINNNRIYKKELIERDAFVEIYALDDKDLFKFNDQQNRYEPIERAEWMTKTISLDGPLLMEACTLDGNGYIRLSMVIRSVETWPKRTGLVALYFNTDVMLPLFFNIRLENATIPYLVDQNGKIVLPYHNAYNLNPEILANQKSGWWRWKDKVVMNTPIKNSDWKLIGLLSENELLKRSRDIVSTFLIVGSITVVILIIVCLKLSAWITSPIIKLSKEMQYVEKNQFKQLPIKKAYALEIKQLYRQFNYMAQRINNLIGEVYMVKIKEKEAELLALQGQINPHFLYNTLDSIAWMSLAYKAEDIRHMVTSLASMMRYSLNEGKNLISVHDELEQIRNYISIQEIRYEGRLGAEIKADKEVLNYKIIKLIIQPLVENAIVHGFKETGNYGQIEVSVKREMDNMVIRVINEGDKIDLEKVKDLLDPNKKNESKHYGLRNVNDRLINKYGTVSAVKFTVYDSKTEAKITIPLILLIQGDSNEDN